MSSSSDNGWRNRIVGSGGMRAGDFLANPHNWRIHPKNQQDGLAGVLDTVGWVQEVIVNQRTGFLVDGHLRVTLALRKGEDTAVPVKYVDLSEEEEALILAALDPIAAMAATDRAKLDEVMRMANSDDERVQAMMAEIAEREGVIPVDGSKWADAFDSLPDSDRAPFQQMTFTLHDSQAETVKDALLLAKRAGDFSDSPNENSNGNALALICERFISGNG